LGLIDGFSLGFSFLSTSISIDSIFCVFVSSDFTESFLASPVSSGCPFLTTLRTIIGLAPVKQPISRLILRIKIIFCFMFYKFLFIKMKKKKEKISHLRHWYLIASGYPASLRY